MKFSAGNKLTKEEEEIIKVLNHQSYKNQEFYKNLGIDQYNEPVSKKFERVSQTFRTSKQI